MGVRVVMVHGGGPQVTEVSEAMGVKSRMVQGRRVTDEKSIEVTTMVLNGLINTRILAICRELNVQGGRHQRSRCGTGPGAQAQAGAARRRQ